MPTLYVANTTKQAHEFVYRVPEDHQPKKVVIKAGAQVVVHAPNLPLEVVSAIVEQHERYGLMDVAELDRRKPFIGLCYRFDKPINVEKIMQADEHNFDVLEGVSSDARKVAAAAALNKISGDYSGGAQVDSVEFEVVAQNGRHEPGLNELVIASRGAPGGEAPRGRGRPRKVA